MHTTSFFLVNAAVRWDVDLGNKKLDRQHSLFSLVSILAQSVYTIPHRLWLQTLGIFQQNRQYNKHPAVHL